jgi:hypothetical protein
MNVFEEKLTVGTEMVNVFVFAVDGEDEDIVVVGN